VQVVTEKGEIPAIEAEVGLQVEEMIVDCEKELVLIPQMAGPCTTPTLTP
jgi:hypothetical protein